MIDISHVIGETSEVYKNMFYEDHSKYKREIIFQYIKEMLQNYKQEIPFEMIAKAIATVKKTEEELTSSIMKITQLHDQYKKLAFNETEMSLYISVDGVNQVITESVKKESKAKKVA